jgi:MoaE-MoaD fusion protein
MRMLRLCRNARAYAPRSVSDGATFEITASPYVCRASALSLSRKVTECTITVVMGRQGATQPFFAHRVMSGGAERATLRVASLSKNARIEGVFLEISGSNRILMQIHVLFFGVLKEIVGLSSDTLDLPEGSRVENVLAHYTHRAPRFQTMLPSIALSVNQEYSSADHALKAGDEVALLPPVSGGAPSTAAPLGEILIVREPIDTLSVLTRLKQPQDGAAVVFEGVVRDNTRGRRTLYLNYESYEAMALKEMESLAQQARERFGVFAISIIHRLGRLEIGETSVLIVVACAHRGAAFDASRWIIDTLKKTVPIWKKEYFEDGAVWADGEPFPEEIKRPAAQPDPSPHPNK